MILKRLTPEQLALLTAAERVAYDHHGPDVNDPLEDACCVGCYDLWPCSLHDAYATIAELRAALGRIKAECGAVCPEFEVCDHPWCNSSAGAWLIADRTLAEGKEGA